MPAPLPPDQLTIVRNLIAKGDTAGAIKVYAEATGATQAEAKTEINNLASRYGLVGSQLPDLFVRRTPPKPAASAAPAEEPAAPAIPAAPPAPAPVAQQAANVPLEPPLAPTPAAAPVKASPNAEAAAAKVAPTQAARPVSVPKPQASPASTTKPAPAASTPTTQKSSRWGCSSVIVLLGGVAGVSWWVLG